METTPAGEKRDSLYYVVQVAPGSEARTEALIQAKMDSSLYGRCFHPLRHVRKKFRGEWRDVHEKLIPGYVFLTSSCAETLYTGLRKVPAFTRLLGKGGRDLFVPLSAGEAAWLEEVTAGGTEAALSQIAVSEGDQVSILSGPLISLEGKIRKIHLHRRIAEVEVDFMGRKTVIHLGIEMVGKDKADGTENRGSA